MPPPPAVRGLGHGTGEQQLQFGSQRLSVQGCMGPSGRGVQGAARHRVTQQWTSLEDRVITWAWHNSGQRPAWSSVYTE